MTGVPPLVDVHCHLLAGVDDGPRDDAEALAMCRIAYEEGTRYACAVAHQNERWRAVTPEVIRLAAAKLRGQLEGEGIDLQVFGTAEVMVTPDLEAAWGGGRLQSVAGGGKYLLVEMPHGLWVDVGWVVDRLRRAGVRCILAHPERHPELLEDPRPLEELVRLGCLVQVSTGSVTAPRDRAADRALEEWFRRGLVHLLGSDGHTPRRRAPWMSGAYRRVVDWVGAAAAERLGSGNGLAVLRGLPLAVPPPAPRPRRWFSRLWGG